MKKLFLLVLISFMVNVSCKAQTEEPDSIKEKIEKAIASSNKWLSLVDSGNYGESWEASSEFFKHSITKEDWIRTLKGLRPSFGGVISREVYSKKYETTLPGAPDGEYVVIVYKTHFKNKEKAYETVTPMKDTDGKWRVSGYFIK
jgi:hypothetical protein